MNGIVQSRAYICNGIDRHGCLLNEKIEAYIVYNNGIIDEGFLTIHHKYGDACTGFLESLNGEEYTFKKTGVIFVDLKEAREFALEKQLELQQRLESELELTKERIEELKQSLTADS